MSESVQLQKLREFGFSQYASRAYLALLELGTTDARSVSRVARIPPPKIYGTLNHLMEKGLARLVLDNPKRYEPVPFADFLAQERSMHLDEARRLEAATPLLAPLFRIAPKASSSDRGSFSLVRGRRNVLQKHRQLAADLRESLLLSLSDGGFARLGHTRTLLEDANARGVRPRVLARLVPGRSAELHALPGLSDVHVAPPTERDGSVGYAVFDSAQAIVTHYVPDDANLQAGHDVAVHITENAIVESLFEMIEERWKDAKPFPEAPARRAPGRAGRA